VRKKQKFRVPPANKQIAAAKIQERLGILLA